MSQGLKISIVVIVLALIIGGMMWSRQAPMPTVGPGAATTTSEVIVAPSSSTDTSDAGLDQDMMSVDSQIKAVSNDSAAAGSSL